MLSGRMTWHGVETPAIFAALSTVGDRPRLWSQARRRFNGAVGADGRSLLSTPPKRALFVLGLYVVVAAVIAVFAGTVTLGTLRVGGFHELDPPGTALWIGAAALGWEFVAGLFSAARRWRGPAGLHALLRTGRAEHRHKPGRRSRVLRWACDAAALAAMVFAILLLRFPNEPSAPRAAIAVLVAIKVCRRRSRSCSRRWTRQSWERVANAWEAIDRPYPQAYARYRQAE